MSYKDPLVLSYYNLSSVSYHVTTMMTTPLALFGRPYQVAEDTEARQEGQALIGGLDP